MKPSELGMALFDIGAIKFGAFKLKLHEKNPDAPLSPIFLNLRTPDQPKPGPLTPELVEVIGKLLYDRIHMAEAGSVRYDAFAGIPHAGSPLAVAFHRAAGKDRRSLHRIRLQKEETSGNRRICRVSKIDTSTCHGCKVLVIDDLITKADSKLEAIQAIEVAGGTVKDVLVLVDREHREQGGKEQLAEKGYILHSVFPLSFLLALYLERERITLEKHDEVLAYLKAN